MTVGPQPGIRAIGGRLVCVFADPDKGKGGVRMPMLDSLPSQRIDYIWLSRTLRPLRAWVPQSEASDHLPVVAEVELR